MCDGSRGGSDGGIRWVCWERRSTRDRSNGKGDQGGSFSSASVNYDQVAGIAAGLARTLVGVPV